MPLTNAQYDSIMREYAFRQNASRQELEERLARIHAAIPSLAPLEDSVTACQAEKVAAAVARNRKRLQKLEDRLTDLIKKRDALLAEHQLGPEDLKPCYACPSCRDTGFADGKKCHCFLQAEIALLYHQSHLKEILEEENFRTFSYSWYEGEDQEIMRRNVAEIRLFIESFDESFRNLLLLGAVGTGKTFLSNCIAKELMDACHSVVYLTAFQLFELLSQATFGGREALEHRQAYPYIFDCDLLIIDDLGTELSNSFTVSQFFLCINERILRKKSTLISSNLDMESLKDIYSERTLSRIISFYTIRQLPGTDIRIRKKLTTGT